MNNNTAIFFIIVRPIKSRSTGGPNRVARVGRLPTRARTRNEALVIRPHDVLHVRASSPQIRPALSPRFAALHAFGDDPSQAPWKRQLPPRPRRGAESTGLPELQPAQRVVKTRSGKVSDTPLARDPRDLVRVPGGQLASQSHP